MTNLPYFPPKKDLIGELSQDLSQYIGKHLFRAREMDLERTSVVHTLPQILRKDSHMLRIPFSLKILSFDPGERKEAVREKVAHPNSFREGKPDF